MVNLLTVSNLSLRFAGANEPVVREVSLHLKAGEKLALVGESGSGKSVLARSLLRLDREVMAQGEIEFAGQSLLSLPESALRLIRGRRIAMIFQEPMTALNPLQAVGTQIAEVLVGYSAAASRNKACELLLRMGIVDATEKLNAFPHQLSGGQRQRVMIAMAVATEPEILIADEPTTALDVTVQAQILELLSQLQAEQGMAVLLISHDLNLVRRFADRVAVMQAGRIVETAPTQQLFTMPAHPYTQALLAARPIRVAVAVPLHSPCVLQVRQLTHAYPASRSWFRSQLKKTVLAKLDFDLHRGQTLAVVGESGSGKTTLALSLLRLLRVGQGGGSVQLTLDGSPALQLSALQGKALRQARQHIQIVFQDPFAALSPRLTIFDLVGEGLLVHRPECSAAERRARVMAVLQEVGLGSQADMDDILSRYPHEFSGGQRQRIAIARVLIMQPQVIVLDEPTSALDATVQQQILQLLSQLQLKFGLSFLLISHDLAVVRALAHRVLVLKNGEVLETGEVERVLSQPQHPYTQQLLAASF
ncbi:ABC transporter ATP-binding protein [Deefgea salmonis]|uniref:Dipeptide ABC transporter ATP-binding protein n=1 Tax=Deefgea salmonis TaxID=2875502 RepID=A0ABS8BHP5_9NEIS|nr:dipeptide ABC transporter ATP-binding protein [Deefgea salmonis]MCB5195121.1 dipeptide ABC transporter ATP-binding protein [Deefgea salmonis]